VKRTFLLALAVILAGTLAMACGDDDNGGNPGTTPASSDATPADRPTGTLTLYSGRNENLVGPLIEQFEADTGIRVRVNYADTTELAVTILEEGSNSPADVFFAQDAGALGALAQRGRLAELPSELLDRVPDPYRSPDGEWVGVSGRARVVAYNSERVSEDELPESIMGFTDPEWRNRIGWAPTNASFQSFVTAMRVLEGEDTAREWLEGIKANNPKEYSGNTPALEAVNSGEVDIAFVNHYYLYRMQAEQGDSVVARNYYPPAGDTGSLVNIAGAGILDTSDNRELAERFIDYLLSRSAQQYFADETAEYPMIPGIETREDLPPLDDLTPPDIDLNRLADVEGTLELLQRTGALP
jgi:iron(III) transport system substrate-binding protein